MIEAVKTLNRRIDALMAAVARCSMPGWPSSSYADPPDADSPTRAVRPACAKRVLLSNRLP